MQIFQYVAIIAAFFLPWTVGLMLTSRKKEEDKKKHRLWLTLLITDAAVIAFSILFSFAMNR